MFITFEGNDGSGKTSQARVLADALRQHGTVLLTREPGGTFLGDQIRSILLGDETLNLDATSQLLLLSAARAQHVREVILPALGRGEVVVCVRYADSTRAYQGGGDGIPEEQIESVIALATGGLEPDLTIYLDIDVVDGLRRREAAREEGIAGAEEGWNSFDARALAFHQRVRDAYLRLATGYPRRFVTVDAAMSFDRVAEEIKRVTLSRLERGQSDGC